jgi:hypothetical protein
MVLLLRDADGHAPDWDPAPWATRAAASGPVDILWARPEPWAGLSGD